MRKSLENSIHVSAQKLIDTLMGYNAPPEGLLALKYGRNMEDIAKERYIKYFEKEHNDTSYQECGICIHGAKQYLGASPDLLLECSCCGKGVLEVKCPYSISNEMPTPENLSYLAHNNEQTILKEKHAYYAQVQGQMAITKRDWCHFLVYTQMGQHLQTIPFDSNYWHELEEHLSSIYINHFAPELVRRK